MAVRLVTPPVEAPISLDEAKAHLRVEHTDDDDLIASYIAAATAHIEETTGRVLVSQTWELIVDAFPSWEIPLPKTPVQSIVSVTYSATDGYDQTIAPSGLYLDPYREPAWLFAGVAGWPSTLSAVNAVRIQFIAGYGNAARVPVALKQAIKLLVGSWYANREAVTDQKLDTFPYSVQALVNPYRLWSL